jgi:alpha-amylase/alpha-mannosidase (GH57 family)
MNRFVCIHGHFYQPPRENPWTDEVSPEESAAPYHDWNERITEECYEPNTHARILNVRGETVLEVNNFSNISFDIGPTLLSWLRRKAPETYEAVLEADRESLSKRHGHGNAMAQNYNHLIMPLASRRDKWTQLVWGIRDFEFHFKRRPEGLWLAETAVDRETLELMAQCGIRFTVLAPHQAYRVRRLGFNRRWSYANHETIDPRVPYRIWLDHGRHIHIFFYEAPVSRAIAFQGLLGNGDELASRLLNAFLPRSRPQLVSTATDGESFGHHHRFGEMAVAYALNKIEEQALARPTNFAEFLERFGSESEVDIYENSSWSCPHGIERWRADCGCRVEPHRAGNQEWRKFLREAFDDLKTVVDEVFEREMGALVRDPWEARNDYIEVMLDDSEVTRQAFLSRHARYSLKAGEKQKFWDLLEAQKFGLFMYTSCGWFFDDVSGLEAVQGMRFAFRALELVQPYASRALEPSFLQTLRKARSCVPGQGTGEDIFMNHVKRSPELLKRCSL